MCEQSEHITAGECLLEVRKSSCLSILKYYRVRALRIIVNLFPLLGEGLMERVSLEYRNVKRYDDSLLRHTEFKNSGSQAIIRNKSLTNFIKSSLDEKGKDLFVVMLTDDWIKPIGADGTFNKNANGDVCECSKDVGAEGGQGFLDSTNLLDGTALSGACCSAYKLYSD